MKASNKSPWRPWLWLGLICLLAILSGFLLHESDFFYLVLLALLPGLTGMVGGCYREWAITIAGAPALWISGGPPLWRMGSILTEQCCLGTVNPPRNPPPSWTPENTADLIGMIVAIGIMLGISAAAHGVIWAFRPQPIPPGHCRECGQDLHFHVDRPCPACGEAVLCRNCGYNLTGNVSGICPECETPVPKPAS